MKVQLSNGLVVEGTAEQIKQVAQTFGIPDPLGPTYVSKTHGEMLVAEMSKEHLRHALVKKVRDWVAQGGLSNIPDDMVLEALRNFPCIDREATNLYTELQKRVFDKPTQRNDSFQDTILNKLRW